MRQKRLIKITSYGPKKSVFGKQSNDSHRATLSFSRVYVSNFDKENNISVPIIVDAMLSIEKKVNFDESVTLCEIHPHQPYASSTFNNNDEIRISVQNQDLNVLPSKSSLHFQGRLTRADGTTAVTATTLVNNAICQLFEEMRYELNAIEIKRVKNVGLTSAMKAFVSLSPGQDAAMENAGWDLKNEPTLTDANGYFDVSIPLNFIFGFAEDYNRIIVNAKHELIMTRANSDVNAILQGAPAAGAAAEQYKITLTKIEWLLPYIKVSDQEKVRMLNYIAADPTISMSFRTWEMYEYPMLPQTTNHVWNVKTSTQLEKPRYVIVGFQTSRKNNPVKSASEFDHCNVRDLKLFLNSQCYPYANLNFNIAQNQFALLYEMYTKFQSSYYGKENEPLLKRAKYLSQAPLIVIDCAKQNESLLTGPVDIRLEFESVNAFPAQTAAYCLILHDRLVEYKPISGIVKKLM